ncbi:MAG: Fe-S-containing hydro-lyase [Clostridia bacterium]|nr:Fe-S-containing hydro-lyase [Clostridia bacterium]
METVKLTTPITKDTIKTLCAGTKVLITGDIYMARDAAHKRMTEALDNGEKLPFELKDQVIYYAGPCPNKPGQVIGSCGPTTSCRMDAYAPRLLDLGLSVMIGKGERNDEVIASTRKNGAMYLGATGGAGALLAKSIKAQEIIAYDDLGAEALRKLYVEDFPAIVLIK